MISKEDVEKVVNAIRAADIRDDVTLCCIVLDVKDGTVGVFGPNDVDMEAVLRIALKQYDKDPDEHHVFVPKDQS